MSMNSVAVLMSVYNGEKYLQEQLDSILAQTGVCVTLLIRDDGSKDKSIQLIREYQKSSNNIRLFEGKNLGVGNSFMTVLQEAGTSYDYYAFADQDDIWLPEKLQAAIELMESSGIVQEPCCCCSNQTLVDSEGHYLRERHQKPLNTSYLQILCDNQISGCTMVWNRALQALLAAPQRLPSSELLYKRIHDVWVSMVAATVGRMIYDPRSFICYRQHEDNVVGVRKTSVFSIWKKKFLDPALRNGRSALAAEILEKYGDQIGDSQIKDRLSVCAYYKTSGAARRQLLRDPDICSCSGESKKAFCAKVIMGLF